MTRNPQPGLDQRIRAGVKSTLFRGGVHRHRLGKNPFPGCAVFCYHGVLADHEPRPDIPFRQLHVTKTELAAHCQVIRDICHPVSLDELLDAIKGDAGLPQRSVLVTFDDGYRSVFLHARDILRHYEIPYLVFPCTEPARQQRLLWYDALARRLGEAAVEERKRVPREDWPESWSATCNSSADTDDPCAPMSCDELRLLARDPFAEIGSHTSDHPILKICSAEEQRQQIGGSRTDLESWLGKPIRAFAYPNGRPTIDYDDSTVGFVEEAGYRCAFTTRHAFALTAAAFELPRFVMTSGISRAELAHRLAYSWPR